MSAAFENTHLSPRAYRALGLLAGAIGLCASAVATWFFVIGLQQTERDALARNALAAAGVLMTLAQLAAFGLAALLPAQRLQRLRWTLLGLGALLFAAEVAVMAVTQLALVQSADAVADASAARITELQRSIEARRAVAAGRRELAATQEQAKAITAAARSLREADAAESAIAPLAAELQQLQAARRPTLTTLLGPEHVALFATVRSALIGLIGLVFMSTAGALLRAARGAVAPAAAIAPAVELSAQRRADLGPAARFVLRDLVKQAAARHGRGAPSADSGTTAAPRASPPAPAAAAAPAEVDRRRRRRRPSPTAPALASLAPSAPS